MSSEKYTVKKKWVYWGGRLLKEDTDELEAYMDFMVSKNLIPKKSRHAILRCALLSLLNTVRKLKAQEDRRRMEQQSHLLNTQLQAE